jgi:hypothetical protein
MTLERLYLQEPSTNLTNTLLLLLLLLPLLCRTSLMLPAPVPSW